MTEFEDDYEFLNTTGGGDYYISRDGDQIRIARDFHDAATGEPIDLEAWTLDRDKATTFFAAGLYACHPTSRWQRIRAVWQRHRNLM